MAILIPDTNSNNEPQLNNDGTPTGGLKFATFNETTGQVKGSNGDDVFTIFDLQRDKDQVITTGLGNDVFRWNGSEGARAGNTTEDVNGIVKFGGAALGQEDNDQVFLANRLSDYQFTLREDGGIKVHYIGTTDGAAVTFYGADSFTFRNIDDQNGTNYETFTLSHDQLVALINSGTAV